MAELEQRLNSLKEEFSELEDGFERYSYLMELGSYLPPYPEEKRTPEHLVRGCQSQVWIHCYTKDGHFFFDADSDTFTLRACFCCYRICSRIFRCRRPQVRIWSCYRSWGCKTSFRIPGKRASVPLLQCSQMRRRRLVNHLNHQQRKNVPLPGADRGTFQLHFKGLMQLPSNPAHDPEAAEYRMERAPERKDIKTVQGFSAFSMESAKRRISGFGLCRLHTTQTGISSSRLNHVSRGSLENRIYGSNTVTPSPSSSACRMLSRFGRYFGTTVICLA